MALEGTSASTTAPSPSRVPIEREASFARLTADNVIVIDRGPDIELSIIEYGPRPAAQVTSLDDGGEEDSPQQTELQTSYVEVGRVRMYPPIAVNMAMNIIERNLAAGRLNISGFRSAIEALLSTYAEGSSGSTEQTRPEGGGEV